MHKLSLATLSEYDQGSLQVLFDRALRDVYLDLDDRPALKKAREVTLTLKLKPHELGNINEGVECEAHVTCKIPNRQARTNILAAHPQVGLGFEADTRHAKFHPDQMTLPVGDESAGQTEGGEAS